LWYANGMNYVLSALIGYILGCFNFAYIIGRLKGIDIREKGTGNAGASNVFISMGKGFGVLTAALDILKGFLAVYICRRVFLSAYCPYIGGVFAVIGHIFPFFMHFKGGKGFASYIGMCLGIDWRLGLGVMVLTVVITLITDYIALATLTTAFLVPVWLFYQGTPLRVLDMYAVLALIILWKHRANLTRMMNHEEKGLRGAMKKKTEEAS